MKNREIKFRAWNISEKRMMVLTDYSWMRMASDGKLLPLTASVCAYYADGDNKGDHKRFYDRNDIILLQFTGLTDKNAVDIYEGDVVCGIRDQKFEVVFREETGCFEFKSAFSGDYYLYGTICDLRIHIIGNIHQHPDLLTPHKQI